MRLIATATAAIVVATGVIFAPNVAEQPTPRTVTQLHSVTIELTSIALATTTSASAAKTPQAAITLPQIQGAVTYIALGAGVIALVPIWYAATPITLPASVVVSTFLYTWLAAIGLVITVPGDPPAPLVALGLGVAGWAVGPLYVANEAVKSVGRYLNSLVSQPDPATGTSASQAPRRDQRPTSGLAGSGRPARTSASPDRKPSTHRSAKTTPKASADKHLGTARSARPGNS